MRWIEWSREEVGSGKKRESDEDRTDEERNTEYHLWNGIKDIPDIGSLSHAHGDDLFYGVTVPGAEFLICVGSSGP